MGIYQDTYNGIELPDSGTAVLEYSFGLLCVERLWPVEIGSRARVNAAHGHQP